MDVFPIPTRTGGKMDDFPHQTLQECSTHIGRHGPDRGSSGGESALKKVDSKIPKYAQSARRASENSAGEGTNQ
jgi:hypothetical protein